LQWKDLVYILQKKHYMKTSFNTTLTRVAAVFLFIATLASSCSDACDAEQPRSRIVNNGSDKASVQIKTSGGSTENINNIETGAMSEWRSFAAGETEFTVVVTGSTDTVVLVTMLECYEYSINISAADQVTSSAVERE
jgi:hypothetical protein